MKKRVAVLLVCAVLSLALAAPARAGSSTDAALALGAFAVFNQFITGQTIFQQGLPARHVVRETVIVQQRPPIFYAPAPVVVYPPPPVVVYPPPPAIVYAPPPPVVVYPNGYGYGYAAPQYYYKPYRRYHRHHGYNDD